MEEEHNRAAKKQMIARVPGRSSVSGSLEDGRNSDQSEGLLSPPAKSTDGKREVGLQDGRHGYPAKLREPV
jgi:hypothetical protein